MSDLLLRGWERTVSGDGVVLKLPQGVIRIRPAIAPLRPFSKIWRERIPPDGEIQGPIAMVSAESEYGAMLNARKGDEQITLVALFGDASYALIEGKTSDPAAHRPFVETVRRLAYGNSLGLGSDRRRPYLYDRPKGWSGIRRAYSTVWVAPDAGQSRASIEVFDARPARNSIGSLQFRRVFEQLPREFGDERPTEPVSLDNRHGVPNQIITFRGTVKGEALSVTDAALVDGRMLYLVRLSSRTPFHTTHQQQLYNVAQSVRPLAVPKADVDVMINWFD